MAKRRHIPASEVGERLRRLRGNELQTRVAERLGITQAELSRYERGRVPDAAMLVHLARSYDVTVDYLLTGKHPPAPQPRVVDGRILKFERAIDRPPMREAVAVVTALFEATDRKRATELIGILKCLRDLAEDAARAGRASRQRTK